jgi:DNA modification methylase
MIWLACDAPISPVGVASFFLFAKIFPAKAHVQKHIQRSNFLLLRGTHWLIMLAMDYTPATSSGAPSIGSFSSQSLSYIVDDIVDENFRQAFVSDQSNSTKSPLLLNGDAVAVLRELPSECIDFAMTSPPYWGKREYESGGIGLEDDYRDFIKQLTAVFAEVKRVLKPEGSFWLNLGDSYDGKGLVGIPWRVAFELIDKQGWILRNSVVWNKLKGGMDNSKDRLGNVHENVFHFVKQAKGYYYDADAIRSKPRESKVVNGAIVSATGVSGVRYKRQIEMSTALSEVEKSAAFAALEHMLAAIGSGLASDFRMIIRGQQRATHSDSEKVSGRAKELRDKGFYFLKYHPKGSKPSDVWDILPEDTQRRETHFAPYPVELCYLPLLATCPEGGTVLDPFCGTGTTLLAARNLGRKSVGIDISRRYLELTQARCKSLV